MAFEVALGYYTPEDLCKQMALDPEAFAQVTTTPAFQRLVLGCRREIDEQGKQFKVLARKLATETLPELGVMALDPDASHADRISAIEKLARFGGLTAEDKGGQGVAAFQVNINLGEVSGGH